MRTQMLSAEQCDRIHETSLAILERTGVEIPHQATLDRFEDAGAKVDRARKRVRIPADLVERLVAGAGREFTLYGRDLEATAPFGQGRRNYNAIAGEASWIDRPGAPRRFATLEDVETAARFCDHLDGINIAGAMADPHEVPVSHRCVDVLDAMLRNTRKPVTFWFHDRASARFIVEMLIALRGDSRRAALYPLCYPFLEPISPLRFPHDGVDLLYETARINLPVPVGPMAQTGISAPATLAATMALENAEILAGICITQLIRSGMPVCYGGICHGFDMRVSQLIFAGPEQAIFGVAMTEMGKRYGLPVYVNVGLTDAKVPDGQAGLEIGATLLPAAAAGADIFGHMGISGVDQASSLEMLLLQNEAIRYVESVLRDVDVSDETLALDVIEEVGSGGSFIDHAHTLMHFRRELWVPDLLDRQRYQPWLDAGGEDLQARCERRKRELLEKPPENPPLSEEKAEAIATILAAAHREL